MRRRRPRPAVEASRLRVGDTVTQAAAAIVARPGRTLLTALGTILGVGAFVTITGLAQTASAQVLSRFDALLATEVRVTDGTPDGNDPFPADVDQRLQALNGVTHAGLMFAIGDSTDAAARAIARRPDATDPTPPVIAATPGAIEASLPQVAAGRVYDDWHQERGERVAVLGRLAADQLGITRIDHQPVVFLGDTAYTVTGIIDEVARNPDVLFAVVIPTTAAATQFDTGEVDRQVVIDTAPGAAQLVGRQAPLALRPQDPDRLVALVPPDPATLRNQVESDVQSLFYALSGLALLVGAVAIANATLLNVIERRAEIGLRRALGATRGHITRQVTVEAALTGTVAGALGTTVGVLAVVVTAIARRWTPTIDPAVLVAAPMIGIVTGTAAGILPALRAARTPPADTLRA